VDQQLSLTNRILEKKLQNQQVSIINKYVKDRVNKYD